MAGALADVPLGLRNGAGATCAMSQGAILARAKSRSQSSFGGVVPSRAWARAGETLVAALAVEHHAEGAVIPFLVVSETPGLLDWDPALPGALSVSDESGREYAVRSLSRQTALGTLQATVWIEPAPPPPTRRLTLLVGDLARTAPARGGGGVRRSLSGGPWQVEVDLLPSRTAVPAPPEPASDAPPAALARVPARSLAAFQGLVPVGQARLSEDAAVCLWALERYSDRSVLTVACLCEDLVQVGPLARGEGLVEIWDDRGSRYSAGPIQGAGGPGWSETSIEVIPVLDPEAQALGVRLSDLPRSGPDGAMPVPGPYEFGLALDADAEI
jgi:hypothetical protein